MKNAVFKRNRATFFITTLDKHKSVTILGHNIFNEKLNCAFGFTCYHLWAYFIVLQVSLLSDKILFKFVIECIHLALLQFF